METKTQQELCQKKQEVNVSVIVSSLVKEGPHQNARLYLVAHQW